MVSNNNFFFVSENNFLKKENIRLEKIIDNLNASNILNKKIIKNLLEEKNHEKIKNFEIKKKIENIFYDLKKSNEISKIKEIFEKNNFNVNESLLIKRRKTKKNLLNPEKKKCLNCIKKKKNINKFKKSVLIELENLQISFKKLKIKSKKKRNNNLNWFLFSTKLIDKSVFSTEKVYKLSKSISDNDFEDDFEVFNKKKYY